MNLGEVALNEIGNSSDALWKEFATQEKTKERCRILKEMSQARSTDSEIRFQGQAVYLKVIPGNGTLGASVDHRAQN